MKKGLQKHRSDPQSEIHSLNRIYTFTREVNRAIVRAQTNFELMTDVCKIAVEVGLYRFAWIGILDTNSHFINPMAYFGFEEGYLLKMARVSIQEDVPEGKGPAGTALREGSPFVINDIETDPRFEVWRTDALDRGYQSCIGLPLIHAQRSFGVVLLYASKKYFFDQEEVTLLREIMCDVSFALHALATNKELDNSEMRYRQIFDHALEGIYRSSVDGELLIINPAFAKIFGYRTPEEMMMNVRNIGEQLFLNPEERYELLQLVSSPDGTVKDFEVQMVRQNRSLMWITIQARLVQGNEFTPSYIEGTIMDITDKKRAEEKLKTLNEQLEQKVLERTKELNEINKELEAFSFSVSHDLRTPLRGLTGLAQIILEDYNEKLDDQGQKYLMMIIDSAKRMHALIEDLLKYSRLGRQGITYTTLEMRVMAIAVFNDIVPEKERDVIDFKVKNIPNARGDHALMRQVWMNLIGNAVKFTSKCKRPSIEVGSIKEGKKVVFYVRDNGAGFDMAYASKMFGVFKRFHGASEYEGNGVGLAIVKRLITRMNGQIWANGEPGKGATFFFTLPVK